MESGPIEVWLTKRNIAVNCMIVNNDETTTRLNTKSLSMRGAQREMTTRLAADGYKPARRWKTEDDRGDETSRTFRR